MFKKEQLDPKTILAVASEADCDPRTVVRVLSGQSKVSRAARRVVQALASRGVALPQRQEAA